MKRQTFLALIAAAGIAAGTAVPAQAAEVHEFSVENGKGYMITAGQACDPEALREILAGLTERFPGLPEMNLPETEAEPILPETEPAAPETETAQPETEPTVPEIEPVQPETDPAVPETEHVQPETEPTAPETEAGSEALSYAYQVAALVNAERAKAGLNPLTVDAEVAAAANIRAKEIEASFSHTRPDGRSFSTALTDLGISFRGAGENIAWGQRSPEEVMNAWMNSEGHRANILNPNYTRIGVGYYQNAAGRKYWTQLFTY